MRALQIFEKGLGRLGRAIAFPGDHGVQISPDKRSDHFDDDQGKQEEQDNLHAKPNPRFLFRSHRAMSSPIKGTWNDDPAHIRRPTRR